MPLLLSNPRRTPSININMYLYGRRMFKRAIHVGSSVKENRRKSHLSGSSPCTRAKYYTCTPNRSAHLVRHASNRRTYTLHGVSALLFFFAHAAAVRPVSTFNPCVYVLYFVFPTCFNALDYRFCSVQRNRSPSVQNPYI